MYGLIYAAELSWCDVGGSGMRVMLSGTTGLGERLARFKQKIATVFFKTAQVAPVSEILLHGREGWTFLR